MEREGARTPGGRANTAPAWWQLCPPLLCHLPTRTKGERNPSLLALLRVHRVTGPVALHALQGSALSRSLTPTWAGPTLDHTTLEAPTGNSPQLTQAPVECGQAPASQPPTHTHSSRLASSFITERSHDQCSASGGVADTSAAQRVSVQLRARLHAARGQSHVLAHGHPLMASAWLLGRTALR